MRAIARPALFGWRRSLLNKDVARSFIAEILPELRVGNYLETGPTRLRPSIRHRTVRLFRRRLPKTAPGCFVPTNVFSLKLFRWRLSGGL